MGKSAKIPTQLYVTINKTKQYTQDRYWTIPEDEREFEYEYLGFLHPHEPGTKADDKRKATQLKWAYGDFYSKCVVEDGVIVAYKATYDYSQYPRGIPVLTRTEIEADDDAQPRVWDNIPLEGFKILHSVRRYSTSNKVWRVLDPRGIEFEISTQSLEDIIMGGSIVNGVIQGKCIWAGNSNLIRVES